MKDLTRMDWSLIYNSLNEKGFYIIRDVLSPDECKHLSGLYSDQHIYRSTINMQRYRFGKGEYKYFNYPLPPTVQSLREILYSPLRVLANEWMDKLGLTTKFPPCHHELVKPRSFLDMKQAATIRCIRIYTGTYTFRFRWYLC
jgi:hypothetical protein